MNFGWYTLVCWNPEQPLCMSFRAGIEINPVGNHSFSGRSSWERWKMKPIDEVFSGTDAERIANARNICDTATFIQYSSIISNECCNLSLNEKKRSRYSVNAASTKHKSEIAPHPFILFLYRTDNSLCLIFSDTWECYLVFVTIWFSIYDTYWYSTNGFWISGEKPGFND